MRLPRGTPRRICLIDDRRLLLYFRPAFNNNNNVARLLCVSLIVASLLTRQCADALRCFAGDPTFQHECTSLSYCLLIVSKTGRSQWSCDGNSFNQISLCSNLGLMEDLITGNRNTDTSSVVFEGSHAASTTNSKHQDAMVLEDDALADYYKRQEDSVRNSLALNDADDVLSQPNRKFFFSNNKISAQSRLPIKSSARAENVADASRSDVGLLARSRRVATAGRSRTPPASIRYYTGQSRCFDGGDLGRICCCSSDLCNRAASAKWFSSSPTIVAFAILIFILISTSSRRLLI